MNIRKYRAENMKEGLAIIKREMGADAVILSTQNVVAEDGRTVLEISVAEPQLEAPRAGQSAAEQRQQEATSLQRLVSELTERIQALQGDVRRLGIERELATAPLSQPHATPRVTRTPARAAGMRGPRALEMRDSLAFGRALDRLEGNEPGFARTVSTMYTTLQAAGVLEEDAEDLIAATIMSDRSPETKPHRLFRSLEKQMAEHLETGPPIWHQQTREQQIALLVGPAGVGKTTTIAKIASRAKLVERRKVGLICVDTYRVAGVYQLLSYAELMAIPMLVADSPDAFKAAVADFHDCDLILVDSTGQNPFARGRALGLEPEALVEAVPNLDVHVCMSAVTQTRALTAMLERYAAIPPASLIFCKLDEATGAGALLSAAMSTGLPISHVCNGPNVPGDILCPTATEIARWVRGAPPAEGAAQTAAAEVGEAADGLLIGAPGTSPGMPVPEPFGPQQTPSGGSPLANVLRRTRMNPNPERAHAAGEYGRQTLAREAG